MLSSKDINRFAIVRKLAETGTMKWRVGAGLYYGAKLVTFGVNKVKSHPLLKTYKPTSYSVHAELNAILRANRTNGCTLYVCRLLVNGDLGASFPCPYCLPHIIEAEIKSIVYWNGTELVKEYL